MSLTYETVAKITSLFSVLFEKYLRTRNTTMVKIVAFSADGSTSISPLSQVMSRLAGGALVTPTPGTAFTG